MVPFLLGILKEMMNIEKKEKFKNLCATYVAFSVEGFVKGLSGLIII